MNTFKYLKLGLLLKLIEREDFISYINLDYNNLDYKDFFTEILSYGDNIDYNSLYQILDKYNKEEIENNFYDIHTFFMCCIKLKFKDWEVAQKKLIIYYDFFKEELNLIEFEFWSRLKDDLSLREGGFSGCMSLPKELNDYFRKFDYNCENINFIKFILYP
ncbi:MAG: hypothetical protein ACJAYP_000213 [Flavobacterium sp.]|jgi:hypothetical protein